MSFDMEMEDYYEDIRIKKNAINILITGVSSGLGKALMEEYTNQGHTVYGITREDINLENVEEVDTKLPNILNDVVELDVVILNAGMLGNISETNNLRIDEFYDIFTVNVLANKVIVDWLLNHDVDVKNIIGISTGAALKTYYGWSLYCTSKAAFNQLLSTYAQEEKDVHFLSLAPGIIKTKMQDYIYSLDGQEIPSVKKFKEMYNTMDTPDLVAERIIKFLPEINDIKSGSYFDLRDIKL